MDQGGFRQINEILTEAQREAYTKYRGRRGGGNRWQDYFFQLYTDQGAVKAQPLINFQP